MQVRCENREGARMDIDFRQLLLWSSTLGVSAFTVGKAKSEPFPAPDLRSCIVPPDDLPEDADAPGGCCPPFKKGTRVVPFKFPTSLPMRTRKAAHLVMFDKAYMKKYEAAVKKMRALPADDPRSLVQQAKVHCAYCNGAYKVGSNYINTHGSWMFAPFHCWYMYFHERILASLIKDDTFALPFWNWDAEEGMSIPCIFTNINSSLYDANRDACHQPPKLINLTDPTSCESGDVKAIYSNIYTHMVSDAETAELFHGGAYSYGSTFKEVEVLIIEGLEMDRSEFSKFDIFINYPEADSSNPFNSPHYAGSFANFGHGVTAGESMKSMSSNESFKLAISETLGDLGADGDEEILVTLVQQSPEKLPKTPIKFSSIRIEYVTK